MKKNFTYISRFLTASVILFLISTVTLLGQTPNTFQYQAVLRDAGGNINSNASVSIQIQLHQGTSTGTVVYSETHATTTSEFGMVNLEIGSGTPATFEAIDWSAGPYFVEVSVDGTSMGTSELLTVPYALHANTVENVEITGTETAFNGWDKDAADDFDGAFSSLTGIPVGLSDGDDNTQLNEAQVEAFINGNETSFNGWDKNAADDFDGAFSSLIGIPAGLSDGDDNTQLNEAQVEAFINGNETSFNGWDKNAADDFTGQTHIQHYFQFVTYAPGSGVPIAFGFINSNGTIASGTGNFTCSWNATNERYVITISGHSYFWTNYATVVTLAQASGEPAIIITDSLGGSLLVTIMR